MKKAASLLRDAVFFFTRKCANIIMRTENSMLKLKDDFFYDLLKDFVESKKDITGFAGLFGEGACGTDEFYIREGEENERIGFLADGVMRSFITDYDGNEATIRFIRRNGLLSGGFAFMVPSTVAVQAIRPAVVYTAKWLEVASFCRERPVFMRVLNRYLALGSKNSTEMLSKFIRLSAKERYLLFIREYPESLEEIPHYHIANHIGITPVQLSRIRKSLRG